MKRCLLSTINRTLKQTAANAEQIKDVEERVQSLGEVLASPVGDRDTEEKARRETLRRFVFRFARNVSISLNRVFGPQEVGWDRSQARFTV